MFQAHFIFHNTGWKTGHRWNQNPGSWRRGCDSSRVYICIWFKETQCWDGGTFRGIHVHVVNIPPCNRMSPTRLIQLVIQHSAPKCLIYEIKPVCPVCIHSFLLPTTRLGHRGSSYSHRIHSFTHSHLRASQSTSCACCVDKNWSTSRTCRGPLEMEAKTQNLLSVLWQKELSVWNICCSIIWEQLARLCECVFRTVLGKKKPASA